MGDSLFIGGEEFKPQMSRIFYRTIAPDNALPYNRLNMRFLA